MVNGHVGGPPHPFSDSIAKEHMASAHDPLTDFFVVYHASEARNPSDGIIAELRYRLHRLLESCANENDVVDRLLSRLPKAKADGNPSVEIRRRWLLNEIRRSLASYRRLDGPVLHSALVQLLVLSNEESTLPVDTDCRAPPNQRRRVTWTPVRQSSIRAMFQLPATTTAETTGGNHAIRRARTLNDDLMARPTGVTLQRGRRATTGQIPPFVRAMAALMGRPMEDTFWCQICFENVPVSIGLELSSCGHRYCQACLKTHLEQKILEQDGLAVCFHPIDDDDAANSEELRTCGVRIPSTQIKAIVDAVSSQNYVSIQSQQGRVHTLACPFCLSAQEYEAVDEPECECNVCGKEFCYTHGSAHQGISCADYEFERVRREKLDDAAVGKSAQSCPSCQSKVFKHGTCNRMTCAACAVNFCWLCNELIDDGPLPPHYDRITGGACRGKQWDVDIEASISEQALTAVGHAVTTAICTPVAMLVTPLLWACSRCTSTKLDEPKTFIDLFKQTRASCEHGFRLMVKTVLFEALQYLLLALCLLPALLMTLVLKASASCLAEDYQAFLERKFATVFSDIHGMCAAFVVAVLGGVLISVALVVGVPCRILKDKLQQLCFSSRGTLAVADDAAEIESGSSKPLTATDASATEVVDQAPSEAPYVRIG